MILGVAIKDTTITGKLRCNKFTELLVMQALNLLFFRLQA
jgi:hypothetical protein